MELFAKFCNVRFDCVRGDVELACNPLVAISLDEKAQHIRLPCSEPRARKITPQQRSRPPAEEARADECDVPDGVHELARPRRLHQMAVRAASDGLGYVTFLRAASHDDHLRVSPYTTYRRIRDNRSEGIQHPKSMRTVRDNHVGQTFSRVRTRTHLEIWLLGYQSKKSRSNDLIVMKDADVEVRNSGHISTANG